FSVSQLARQARLLIEQHLGAITVEGELSNFRKPGSGHWYFTLKDDAAQIRCAMFAGRNRLVRLPVADGLQVRISGRVSLFEPRGDFQIIANRMEAAGEGALRAAFEALKLKLADEGLFDDERKRPLPEHPRHITIISSASGAALRDVLHVIERRFPALTVLLIPSTVQGNTAEGQLIRALEAASRIPTDIVLITRGGGSLEDLWAFNLEGVARAIAACPHPTVSAIGHQTDFTITDFVADFRAPTPSAAAELITPTREDLANEFTGHIDRLQRTITQEFRHRRQHLEHLQTRLVDPAKELEAQMQRIDDLESRSLRAWTGCKDRMANRLDTSIKSLALLTPDRRIREFERTVAIRMHGLQRAFETLHRRHRLTLAGSARALSAVSPLNTLDRGYAVLTSGTRTITSVTSTSPGETLRALLKDGALGLTVTAVDSEPPFKPPPMAES
ncbi:MAG: exodeoxyribonuclease VII large subunit, partial [Pseudomonadales bacterium]